MVIKSGVWEPGKAKTKELDIDTHTTYSLGSIGGGLKVIKDGVGLSVDRGRYKVCLHMGLPGMHSLYYSQAGSSLVYADSRAEVRQSTTSFGHSKARIHQLKSGVAVVFDGKKIRRYQGERYELPSIFDGSLEEAVRQFKEVFLEATQDVVETSGIDRAACMLSAGTDSTLTAWALREVGVPITTYSVGRTQDDFDPKYAAKYAEELGVPFVFVGLPGTKDELHRLAEHSISRIELADYSNVLMAMCTALVRDRARLDGYTYLFHGHFADDLVGNSSLTWGGYTKEAASKGQEVSSQGWRDYRARFCMHLIPNNYQVAKISRVGGMDWRAIFYHPKVIRFMLSLPLEYAPLRSDKVVYKEALRGVITGGAWEHHKKVGYYTGAGIGKLRLSGHVSDELFRSIYRRLEL